jgi:Fe-Mn family superoxide dismutase
MMQAQIPYKSSELVPILSNETLDYHYGKHHCGYANTLNTLITNTKFENLLLEEIIIQARNVDQKIFNNASQVFNHNFYWKCLKLSNEQPTQKLKNLIENQFGSFEGFIEQYKTTAGSMFGSGWCWLVIENETLSFINSQNAENPIGTNKKPICVIDLWEHSYYIDYRNDRASYISKVLNECINWKFCEEQI